MYAYIHVYIRTYIHIYVYIYIYIYIPWIHKLVTQSVGCRTSHKNTSIRNFYSVKYNKYFTQQYYRSYSHIINLSTEYKECVFKYFHQASLNFMLPFWRIVTLGGKLLKVLKRAQNVLFFKNKIGWHLVYEDGDYSLY